MKVGYRTSKGKNDMCPVFKKLSIYGGDRHVTYQILHLTKIKYQKRDIN